MFYADNTFYVQVNGMGHMVKDHSNNERENPLLLLYGLLLPAGSKINLLCTIPQDRIVHITPLLC